MAPLDHQFGLRKNLVVPCMVEIEMCADQIVDISGSKTDRGEPVPDIVFRMHFHLQAQRALRSRRVLDTAIRVTAINENVASVLGLDHISRNPYTKRLQNSQLQ
jgi:hypothetical protein